jgi:hypothetical protein
VLGVGLAVRMILIPITHGQDFVVWDKASAATLRGINIYAHHPNYPGGPFAYFPLFVYIEVPFRWLALHTGISFTVLGKLPILLADIACAMLIHRELRRRGLVDRAAALGVALFFLNPLVLYDSAYYGRFDTVGCAFLLAALAGMNRGRRTLGSRAPLYYALAVAAKTFPAFLLAGVLRAAGSAWRRTVAVVIAVLVAISLPYLGAPHAFAHDLFFYDAAKPPQTLSWQQLLLHVTSVHGAKLVSYLLLALFAAGTIWLARIRDLWRYTVVVLVLFLLCSKVVLEQYLIWPMPWLVLLGWRSASTAGRAALALVGVFTIIGLLDCESMHPLGRSSALLEVVLASACVGYLLVDLLGRRGRTARTRLTGSITATATGSSHQTGADVASAST